MSQSFQKEEKSQKS